MTGYSPNKCPNHEDCKRNALHSENRKSRLPYEVFNVRGFRELIVWRTCPEEAKAVGWHPSVSIPYRRGYNFLIVGEIDVGIVEEISEDAKNYGYAIAEYLPYFISFNPKKLTVKDNLPQSQKKEGWKKAIPLPYRSRRNENRLIVDFDPLDSDYKDAIAAGWHPAISL